MVTSLRRCTFTINFGLQHTLTFENVFHSGVESTQVDFMLPMHSWYFDLTALKSLCQRHVMSAEYVLALSPSLSFLIDAHFDTETPILSFIWIESAVSKQSKLDDF